MSYVDDISKETKTHYSTYAKYDIRTNENNSIQYSYVIVESSNVYEITGDYDTIQFSDCYFTSLVTIRNCRAKQIIFENCHFDSSFMITDTIVSGVLSLFTLSVKRSLSVVACEIEDLQIFLNYADDIVISSSQINNSFVTGDNTLTLRKAYVSHIKGVVQFGFIKINEFTIIGVESEAMYIFDGVRVLTMMLDSIRNYKEFRVINFESLPGQSKFEIRDSYLGKAEFYDVDFESFNTVAIARTHLTDCSFIDVDWNFNMNAQYDDNNDEYSSRETFRQLKYALGKQGDTINEQKFHTLEMRAHYKSLDWDTDGWNKAIIWLSYNTSNFGQSLWWPIRALLIGHTLFFLIAMLTGLSSVHISFTNASWSAFNTAVYEYFNFINPLHKVEEEHQNWIIIIDIFMRIWSSYMIYNIIRASRRFIK